MPITWVPKPPRAGYDQAAFSPAGAVWILKRTPEVSVYIEFMVQLCRSGWSCRYPEFTACIPITSRILDGTALMADLISGEDLAAFAGGLQSLPRAGPSPGMQRAKAGHKSVWRTVEAVPTGSSVLCSAMLRNDPPCPRRFLGRRQSSGAGHNRSIRTNPN